MIANAQPEVQIMDTHESPELFVYIGIAAGNLKANRTLVIVDVNEGWNVAAQAKQRMHLDGSFCSAEICACKDA